MIQRPRVTRFVFVHSARAELQRILSAIFYSDGARTGRATRPSHVSQVYRRRDRSVAAVCDRCVTDRMMSRETGAAHTPHPAHATRISACRVGGVVGGAAAVSPVNRFPHTVIATHSSGVSRVSVVCRPLVRQTGAARAERTSLRRLPRDGEHTRNDPPEYCRVAHRHRAVTRDGHGRRARRRRRSRPAAC